MALPAPALHAGCTAQALYQQAREAAHLRAAVDALQAGELEMAGAEAEASLRTVSLLVSLELV